MVQRQPNGFTLLEMVVAITALAVLAMLVTPYLSLSVRAYNDNAMESRTLAELRYASERIARELRDIRRNPSPPSNYDIVLPSSPTASFAFIRNDATTVTIERTAPLLNLRYSSLASDAPFPLSTSLQSLTFNFLRSDETQAFVSAEVAYIEFEIQLASNGKTYSQRSRVALRTQP
jgi:prepilin-type N-terminal cleavage/methylation domain-containing protein